MYFILDFLYKLVVSSIEQVGLSLLHNWPYLLLSVIIAALLKLYLDANRASAFLNRHRGAGVAAATAVAVTTPLCSCGTTAVVLGMMATAMPWAPIVAFMVASPLTSPEELVYSAGLFGWPFALAFFISSILLGLGGGWIAALLEKQGWLANQTRFQAPASIGEAHAGPAPLPACACSSQPVQPARPVHAFALETALSGRGSLQLATACACSSQPADPAPSQSSVPARAAIGVSDVLKEMLATARRLLPLFLGFAFIGFFLNGLIPANWISGIFGSGHIYSVPLAATLGLPLYLNTEASLPLVRGLLGAGMSQGAALAFMIAGSGTSIGAIAGALTIARWRVVALVIAILWAGAILTGFTYDLVLALHLF